MYVHKCVILSPHHSSRFRNGSISQSGSQLERMDDVSKHVETFFLINQMLKKINSHHYDLAFSFPTKLFEKPTVPYLVPRHTFTVLVCGFLLLSPPTFLQFFSTRL